MVDDFPWVWAHVAPDGATHVLVDGPGGPVPAGGAACNRVPSRDLRRDRGAGDLCRACETAIRRWGLAQLEAALQRFNPRRSPGEKFHPLAPPAPRDPLEGLIARLEDLEVVVRELAPGQLEALWAGQAAARR